MVYPRSRQLFADEPGRVADVRSIRRLFVFCTLYGLALCQWPEPGDSFHRSELDCRYGGDDVDRQAQKLSIALAVAPFK